MLSPFWPWIHDLLENQFGWRGYRHLFFISSFHSRCLGEVDQSGNKVYALQANNVVSIEFLGNVALYFKHGGGGAPFSLETILKSTVEFSHGV